MTAAYDFATGRVALPTVPGVSHSALWHVGYEIAKSTNQTTKESWLAVDTIVRRTGLSERTVQRARAALVAAGVYVEVDTNRKSQVYRAGWRVSARKKHLALDIDPDPIPGMSRSTSIMLCTFWEAGKRTTKELIRLGQLSVRTVRTWVKYMAPVGGVKQVAPVQRTLSPTGFGESSGTLTSSSGRPTAQSRRRERWKKATMPWDLFKDNPSYVPDESLVRAAEKASRQKRITNRRNKPTTEWSVKDVVDEFRQRYDLQYPMHSPDELGNYTQMLKILGKLKNDGVTIKHMIASIDAFYAQHLDRIKHEYPAWRKYLWLVRDTRPKDEREFAVQQEAIRVIPESAPVVHAPVIGNEERLERARMKLEAALEDPDLYLANNGQQSIAILKSEVTHYERKVAEQEGTV